MKNKHFVSQKTGLRLRHGIWHIEKNIANKRYFLSTAEKDKKKAEQFFKNWLISIIPETIPPKKLYTLRQGWEKYKISNLIGKKQMESAILPFLEKFGSIPLININPFLLNPWIEQRKKDQVKNRTINYPLEITRRILKLATTEWYDEYGRVWIDKAPFIKLLPVNDGREARILSFEEQDALFALLPDWYQNLCLFLINTGLRNSEITKLEWAWEYKTPFDHSSFFIIPKNYYKNRRTDRMIVLNSIARECLEKVRGEHSIYVFPSPKGGKLFSALTTKWKESRKKIGIDVRIHDLRHTFGSRLRAAGISQEDRIDLMGHLSKNITHFYSKAQIRNLINSVEKLTDRSMSAPIIHIIKREKYGT